MQPWDWSGATALAGYTTIMMMTMMILKCLKPPTLITSKYQNWSVPDHQSHAEEVTVRWWYR